MYSELSVLVCGGRRGVRCMGGGTVFCCGVLGGATERGREGREGSGGGEALPEFLECDGDICESRF